MIYRGRGAAERLRACRPSPDEPPVVAVPGSDVKLVVVDSYVHLGSPIAASGSTARLAQDHRINAMKAYAPLATKVFGALQVSLRLREFLLNALVLSRLLFNVHVVVPNKAFYRVLNDVYMRAVRRLHGQARFGDGPTDLQVRMDARAPSIDCLVMRARLRYLRRLLVAQPAGMLALLASRPAGHRLPWLSLVAADMQRLRALVSECASLPCPEACAQEWYQFILADAGRWSRVVSMLFFTDSVCDRDVVAPSAAPARPFVCAQCAASFCTARELGQHSRIKHGARCQQRMFAPASAVCPVCGTMFRARLRLLAHLCDSRRPKFWHAILADPVKYPPLSAKMVEELDMQDNELRKAARRAGHSHHLAEGLAIRANGSCIGRARL